MRVLVIEDDQEMADAIAVGLRRAQMAVDVALNGHAGLERALLNGYDVIVLDRDLPGLHGDEVCRRIIASQCRSRVLMLTAAATTEDLVDGLGLGADDYLAKPFDFPVLVARIRALLRRAQPAMPPSALRPTSCSTRHNVALARGGGSSPWRPRSSACSSCCSSSQGRTCRPRSCSSESGTKTPTRSATPSRSRSAACAPSSAILR